MSDPTKVQPTHTHRAGAAHSQKIQAQLHDGPPLRQAVMVPPRKRGDDAEEH